ncbi:hypothetical protein WJX84_003161 [Apatococcus fuscideae]|uniref:Amidohydrolase 3 domain-containing protein n=1 Tax=Apatococcus fuscideae TaxID=2026836 RepID=A0AAW1TA82_9CHLO
MTSIPNGKQQKGSRGLDLTLIEKAEAIYGPHKIDDASCLLVAGTQVVGLLSTSEAAALKRVSAQLRVLDASGCVVIPGFVDMRVHITGGGGEAGPASRCPEAQLSQLLDAGITTAVGLLGTDGVSRSQESLIAKCRALNQEGLTCFHLAGSYGFPPATTTGSLQRDLVTIETCLGVGPLAVSDHRSSAVTGQEIARVASEGRVGGMLGGKCGLLWCRMGSGADGFAPLREALAASDLPISQLLPTHAERPMLLADCRAWLRAGGNVDFTAGVEAQSELELYMQPENHMPLDRISVSSGAFGSQPAFDSRGRLTRFEVALPGSLLILLQSLVGEEGWPLERALPLVTLNPATRLHLPHKGRIAVGSDADLIIADKDSLVIQHVFANGHHMKSPEWTRGGFFEHGPGIRRSSMQPVALKRRSYSPAKTVGGKYTSLNCFGTRTPYTVLKTLGFGSSKAIHRRLRQSCSTHLRLWRQSFFGIPATAPFCPDVARCARLCSQLSSDRCRIASHLRAVRPGLWE